ncbi:MAG TPA: hypothetical protein DCO75_13615 [Fibrobacteres bacterium]|nr:hypothetical protein [Fibrobacterota bacterium]
MTFKRTWTPEKCIGCERCVEVCPHAIFEINDGHRLCLINAPLMIAFVNVTLKLRKSFDKRQ